MTHDHDHGVQKGGGHAHGHAVSADADATKLKIALGLICVFMVVEVVAGVLVHSLALLADAGHMLTDAGALGLALFAMNLARRPAKGPFTFGFKRAEILSAAINGATLLALGLLIVYEGISRLIHPPKVPGVVVLVVALAGVAVNLAATWMLARANRTSLNVEGAFQHILTDLYAFIATAVAGLVIILTNFTRADGLAALLVAALMLRAAYGLLRASGRVLLEAAPVGMDPDAIGTTLVQAPGVSEVHDLHIWEVSSGFPALSAHILVEQSENCQEARRRLASLLDERFGIDHTTLQVDHARPRLINPVRRSPGNPTGSAQGKV